MTLHPGACAVFLLIAFSTAGFFQTAWFASRWSRAFAIPIDGGLTWRGTRLLGDNKTIRGFVVMVPAVAGVFALLSASVPGAPGDAGLWALAPASYAALGAWAGFGFMAGELPNSFVKRRLGIEPGAGSRGANASPWQLGADRLDSGIGMLLALSLVVPTPWQTWLLVLAIGPFIHWAFSVLLFRLGIKPRPA